LADSGRLLSNINCHKTATHEWQQMGRFRHLLGGRFAVRCCRIVAVAPRSRILYESQIEGCKHQDNTDVHHEPFPESILKEKKIYANDNGYHHQTVKRYEDALCHCIISYGDINSHLPIGTSRGLWRQLSHPLLPHCSSVPAGRHGARSCH
jgi:hypothetical protein